MRKIFTAGILGIAWMIPRESAAFAPIPGINKDSAQHYYNLGQSEFSARKYANAWRMFDKAAGFDPDSWEVQKGIYESCMQMNRVGPAIKALEKMYTQKPNDEETLLNLNKMYFNFGNWEKTVETGLKAKQLSPQTVGINYKIGKSYYSMQDYGKAEMYLQKAIKEDAKNAEAYYLIANMQVQMENYKAALPYYDQSLKLDTGQQNRYYEYALVLATAGEYEQSVEWFKKTLVKGYKPMDDFYINYAYTLADAHKTEQAMNILKDIQIKRPQDLSLLNSMAHICYQAGKFREAIDLWDQVLEKDGKNGRSLYMIGLTYIKMGKDAEGKKLCDQAIMMDPSLKDLKMEKKLPF